MKNASLPCRTPKKIPCRTFSADISRSRRRDRQSYADVSARINRDQIRSVVCTRRGHNSVIDCSRGKSLSIRESSNRFAVYRRVFRPTVGLKNRNRFRCVRNQTPRPCIKYRNARFKRNIIICYFYRANHVCGMFMAVVTHVIILILNGRRYTDISPYLYRLRPVRNMNCFVFLLPTVSVSSPEIPVTRYRGLKQWFSTWAVKKNEK